MRYGHKVDFEPKLCTFYNKKTEKSSLQLIERKISIRWTFMNLLNKMCNALQHLQTLVGIGIED